WRHRRTIYFQHQGVVVVADDADGPAGTHAALTWHLAGEPALQVDRIRLRGGDHPAEMLLLPTDGSGAAPPRLDDETSRQVVYETSSGRIGLVTVFLTGPWVGAQVELRQESGQSVLRVTQGDQRIELRL